MTSIHRYLLVGMLGALTLAGVGAAVGVYTQTLQERTSDSLLKMDIRATHEGGRLKAACL